MKQRSDWEHLQDLWLLGEPLSSSEQRARLEGADHPAQLRELQFYERARHWRGETSTGAAEDNARFVEQVLRHLRGSRNPGLRLVGENRLSPAPPRELSARAKPRALPIAAWLMASAAAAAAIGLVLHAALPTHSTDSSAPALASSGSQGAACQLVSFSGVVETRGALRVGEPLREGDSLRTGTGSACLTIGGTARVCLPSDSALLLSSLDPKHIRIQVERGASIAALSPRPAGSFFSLTGHGVVATAHGTIFALELTEGARGADVTVFEGGVEVESVNDRALVEAGSRARFDGEGRSLPRIFVDRQERDRSLAWLGTPLPHAQPAVPSAMAQVSPTEISAQTRSAAPNSSERADSPVGLDQGALFAAARKQAGLGNARKARGLYRELLNRFPGPGTASVQVVLGNLEMDLGAPERALTAFEAYLHSGGPLEPEALHGKVRALRALGRTASEIATIRNYLARYPTGFQAPALKKRLQELE